MMRREDEDDEDDVTRRRLDLFCTFRVSPRPSNNKRQASCLGDEGSGPVEECTEEQRAGDGWGIGEDDEG